MPGWDVAAVRVLPASLQRPLLDAGGGPRHPAVSAALLDRHSVKWEAAAVHVRAAAGPLRFPAACPLRSGAEAENAPRAERNRVLAFLRGARQDSGGARSARGEGEANRRRRGGGCDLRAAEDEHAGGGRGDPHEKPHPGRRRCRQPLRGNRLQRRPLQTPHCNRNTFPKLKKPIRY